MVDVRESETDTKPTWYQAMEKWECPRCIGRGHLDSWGDEPCLKCNGSGYYVSPDDVRSLVDQALDRMAEHTTGEFNPLHVRNVILNCWLGPDIGYTRARHALGRNSRVKHLRTKRYSDGSLAIYGWAEADQLEGYSNPHGEVEKT